ncbi:hypothetical protein F5X99DRAFT_361998 [Biscogniauxia marginata]|nr:hypothetical protein F5X99DRAFT_361998 [Biscogniauxia marginata]
MIKPPARISYKNQSPHRHSIFRPQARESNRLLHMSDPLVRYSLGVPIVQPFATSLRSESVSPRVTLPPFPGSSYITQDSGPTEAGRLERRPRTTFPQQYHPTGSLLSSSSSSLSSSHTGANPGILPSEDPFLAGWAQCRDARDRPHYVEYGQAGEPVVSTCEPLLSNILGRMQFAELPAGWDRRLDGVDYAWTWEPPMTTTPTATASASSADARVGDVGEKKKRKRKRKEEEEDGEEGDDDDDGDGPVLVGRFNSSLR